MFNRSRKVACPDCRTANAWKGVEDPQPTDELHCRRCGAFITNHEEYIRGMVRLEVSRIMQRYADPDSAYQLSLLKTVLARGPQGMEMRH